MIVLGLDPGTEKSACVVYGGGNTVGQHVVLENDEMLRWLETYRAIAIEVGQKASTTVLVIEKIESYGMAVGESTFATVFWSGRFAQAWSAWRFVQLGRRHVKQHLCHTARATDSNIRQAILDRFGGEKAIGKKATPGPLYGIKGHEFAALAVALTWHDQNANQPAEIRPGMVPEF